MDASKEGNFQNEALQKKTHSVQHTIQQPYTHTSINTILKINNKVLKYLYLEDALAWKNFPP
jgi:hypothetical protein